MDNSLASSEEALGLTDIEYAHDDVPTQALDAVEYN